MRLEPIPPNFVCQAWPVVSTFIKNALEHSGGEYSAEQLQFALVRGEQSLLVVIDDQEQVAGAVTVTFENYPAERVAFITAIGGRLISTPEAFEDLMRWAKANGCTRIRGAARESVARLWHQKFGFEPRYIIVEKSL